ncbi:MAG TPA: hypothetical protein VMU65_15020 [Candidatus Saccharimonadales bacterium]|nr:hypothetical protein [Candidatus Saccharimonadales bacterium]
MRRLALTLAFSAFLLGAARLTLGPPDLVQALAFFAGGIPTQVAAESVTILLAWLVIIVAVFGLVGTAAHGVDRGQLLRRPSTRAAILLTASLVLLIVGVVHRSIPPASLCCGSEAAGASEAIKLAQ